MVGAGGRRELFHTRVASGVVQGDEDSAYEHTSVAGRVAVCFCGCDPIESPCA